MAVYFGWGAQYLAIRFGLESVPPLLFAGSSALASGLLLYGAARLAGSSRPAAAHWKGAALTGFLLLYMGTGGVTWAEQFVPSALAALCLASEPIWMVLMDWFFFKGARPGVRVSLGIFLGLAGVGSLVWTQSAFVGGSAGGWLAIFIASLAWALGSLCSRRVPSPDSPLLATALPMMLGGTALVITGLFLGEATRWDPAGISARSAAAFLYVTLVSCLLAYTAYLWLLKNVDLAKVTTYAYVNPLVAVLLGWSLGGERVDVGLLLGAALVLGAVVLILTYKNREI